MAGQPPPPHQTFRFEFTGRAGEYFRIWIVNLFLTILTLGVYSAWAKVRKLRYLYGSTRLAGATFHYLADPIKILKGRLLVVGIFVVAAISATFFPLVEEISGLLFLALVPWLVVKARTFSTRNTAYRNIRLDFAAPWGEAYLVLLGLPILTAMTLGLAYPYFVYRRSRLLVGYSGYGTARFAYGGDGWSHYTTLLGIYAKALLVLGGTWLAAGFLFAQGGAGNRGASALLLVLLGALGLLAAYAYLISATTNFIWSNVSLGNHRFVTALEPGPLLWLYLSNTLAILVSMGLLIPWATIRLTRYRLEQVTLLAAGDLDDFVAGRQAEVSAAGEEISDFYDVDIGL